MAKKKQAKGRQRIEMKRTSAKSNVMDTQPDTSGVFQYMREGLTPAQSHSGSDGRSGSSSSSTSLSSDIERDETSSHDDEPIVESPMTSPPSTSRSLDKTSEPHEINYDSGISARGSSPKSNGHTHSGHQPSMHDSEEEEEEKEEEEEEKEEGEEEEEEEAEEEKDDGEEGESEDDDDGEDEDQDASRNYTSEKAAPPVLPSDSTSHRKKDVEHDRHYHRLKDQEKELREHVLQSPQPQRDFHFFGGPSPTPQPAIPFLDPHSQYGASANPYPQTPPALGWRPAAPAPPPGDFYSPPQVPHIPLHPTADNIYAMTAGSIPGPPNTLAPPPPFQYPQVQPPHYLARPTGPDLSKTTVIGYELLADKLSEFPKENVTGEDKIIPMYRKFEQLNHRILLHLQDEISELEDELRNLDECIAQMSPVGKEGRPQPASRRMESRHGGELHWRRTNLLGRIYLKLGQYNQALSSYSTMIKNLDPANNEDLQVYRTWMEKHAPVEKFESQFLDHKNDLFSIARTKPASNASGVGPVQSAGLGLLLILVLPLLAFAMIPGLLGRLFIIILIGSAEVAVVASTELISLMTVKEWVICASIYFAIMAILAGVVQ